MTILCYEVERFCENTGNPIAKWLYWCTDIVVVASEVVRKELIDVFNH